MMNHDDRINRLEEYHTVLQQHVMEQDKVILDLSESLDRLKRELGTLRSEMASSNGQPDSPEDERPPHY